MLAFISSISYKVLNKLHIFYDGDGFIFSKWFGILIESFDVYRSSRVGAVGVYLTKIKIIDIVVHRSMKLITQSLF